MVHEAREKLTWYQVVNTAVHWHVLPSLDLKGDSFMHDLREIQRFVVGTRADGKGLVQWATSFADVSSIEMQSDLLDKIRARKITANATCNSLFKHIETLLDYWLLLNESDEKAPMSFYKHLSHVDAEHPKVPIWC